MQHFPDVRLTLPEWIGDLVPAGGIMLSTVDARMDFVIRLSRRNVEEGSGGPFAAAVFVRDTGKLIAPGVNRVVPMSCSAAHAEMMAMMTAQQVVGSFDLGGEQFPAYELVTSAEPCAMCLGAIPWSGVRRVVCGASKEDAEQAGFDEGDRPENWVAGLQARGIDVIQDQRREDAAAVLRMYTELGGLAYNGRRAGML